MKQIIYFFLILTKYLFHDYIFIAIKNHHEISILPWFLVQFSITLINYKFKDKIDCFAIIVAK